MRGAAGRNQKRVALVSLLVGLLQSGCGVPSGPRDAGPARSPRLQACTIEVEDLTRQRVLTPNVPTRLEVRVRAVRQCTESSLRPEAVSASLVDDDGQALPFTFVWENRLDEVIGVFEFVAPSGGLVRASATIEPGFGVVRWSWPIVQSKSLPWNQTGRPALGFLDVDGGRIWFGTGGVQVERADGGFSAGSAQAVAATDSRVWVSDLRVTRSFDLEGQSRVEVPLLVFSPTAIAASGQQLLFFEDGRALVVSADAGVRVSFLPPTRVGLGVSGAEFAPVGRVRLCRGGRVEEVFISDLSNLPPPTSSGRCGRSVDGFWAFGPTTADLLLADGGRVSTPRPPGTELRAPFLVTDQIPLTSLGATLDERDVVWVPVVMADGGLEGRSVALPARARANAFDGRHLFITGPMGDLWWADPR
jgi:hypothetical protein